jgi:hypothetical protein
MPIGQEGPNVKDYYQFDNHPIKTRCFEHKTRMKVDHRIKISKLCKIVFFNINFGI